MAKRALLTIGVYGFSEAGFFDALTDAGADCLCDIRARRGVRGSTYAFANAARLESRLSELGVPYVHLKDLAPSDAVREAQKKEDAKTGTKQRERETLGKAFRDRYAKEIIAGLDAEALLDGELKGYKRPAFLCVERHPDACHRSLLVAELSKQTRVPIEHIVP